MLRVSVIAPSTEKQAVLETRIGTQFPTLQIDTQSPDVMICYGGDGTFLYAEEHYPEVPKVLLRNTMLCEQHAQETETDILGLLSTGEYAIRDHARLMVTGQKKNEENLIADDFLVGTYDISIGHTRINTTIRMRVNINGRAISEEIVGDGLVVSTPLGATGYYQSITRSHFTSGIGIAFNNSVNTVTHMVVAEDSVISVEVTRGPGVLAADNQENMSELNTGDTMCIEKSDMKARLVTFAGENDKYNFAMNRLPAGACQLCGVRF